MVGCARTPLVECLPLDVCVVGVDAWVLHVRGKVVHEHRHRRDGRAERSVMVVHPQGLRGRFWVTWSADDVFTPQPEVVIFASFTLVSRNSRNQAVPLPALVPKTDVEKEWRVSSPCCRRQLRVS
jgi:hypothetical protein